MHRETLDGLLRLAEILSTIECYNNDWHVVLRERECSAVSECGVSDFFYVSSGARQGMDLSLLYYFAALA